MGPGAAGMSLNVGAAHPLLVVVAGMVTGRASSWGTSDIDKKSPSLTLVLKKQKEVVEDFRAFKPISH